MADAGPGGERPYRIDDEFSRAVFARRTGEDSAFFTPHLHPGMTLIDCGCGPGAITADLAKMVAPGQAVGIDLRENALTQGRSSRSKEASRTSNFRQRASIACHSLMPLLTRP